MRIKYVALLALMLCIGAFLFPQTALASESGNPPTVRATVEGELLRIEASGGFLGVEAIFINGQRFNFRVDGVLNVDLLAFREIETISVYAVDFAGHRSNTVEVRNPHYIGLTSQQTQPNNPPQSNPPQGGIPVTPSQSNPFTPDGQASVLDNATNDDEKEFFTFTTPAGNVFFLIVDRQRGTDNVYFLNAVTEQDLMALAEQSGNQISGTGTGGIPVSTVPQTPDDEQPDNAEQAPSDPSPADSGGGNGTMIFLLVAIAIAGGVGYYLKIVRPKQQASGDYDDEDEDEEDIGEEMQFEDDPEDADMDTDMDGDYYNTDDEEQEDDE